MWLFISLKQFIQSFIGGNANGLLAHATWPKSKNKMIFNSIVSDKNYFAQLMIESLEFIENLVPRIGHLLIYWTTNRITI